MRFIHYTSNIDSIIGILKNGFIINPCERKTLGYFTNRDEFKDREPQYFGMVCLHGFKFAPSFKYWRKYGPYGIEMDPKWVKLNNFRKVLYTKNKGLLYRHLKRFCDSALLDLDSKIHAKFPDDAFRHMSYTNKNVALVLGAKTWADFLTVFEYMEPNYNRYEREWRYVREDPFYYSESIGDIISSIKRDLGWSRLVYPLKFECNDVVRLYAFDKDKGVMREKLPQEYSGLKISCALNNSFMQMQSLTRLLC